MDSQLLGADDGWEAPSSSASPESSAATEFIAQCFKCPTAPCAARKCRRQTDKYPRGYVVVCDSCPKHVHTYLRCVICQKTIHVGCDDGGVCARMSWAGNWKCFACAAAVASLYDAATSGPGAATSGAGAATSGAQPPIVVAAAETGGRLYLLPP